MMSWQKNNPIPHLPEGRGIQGLNGELWMNHYHFQNIYYYTIIYELLIYLYAMIIFKNILFTA
jgi:hypothetical protein